LPEADDSVRFGLLLGASLIDNRSTNSVDLKQEGDSVETDSNDLREQLEHAQREIRAIRRQMRIGRLVMVLIAGGVVAFVATRSAATQSRLFNLAQGPVGTRVRGPLVILDSAERPILQVGASVGGRGLILFDEAGNLIGGFGVTTQGRGLVVYDGQQKLVGALGEGQSADGSARGRGLTLFDPNLKVIATLGQGDDGASRGRGLTVNDTTGAPVAGLGVWPQRPESGQLVLTERDGKPVFAQPPLPVPQP
jgi:hypothetical protein